MANKGLYLIGRSNIVKKKGVDITESKTKKILRSDLLYRPEAKVLKERSTIYLKRQTVIKMVA